MQIGSKLVCSVDVLYMYLRARVSCVYADVQGTTKIQGKGFAIIVLKMCGHENGLLRENRSKIYFLACFSFFLGRRTAWMLGKTPP